MSPTDHLCCMQVQQAASYLQTGQEDTWAYIVAHSMRACMHSLWQACLQTGIRVLALVPAMDVVAADPPRQQDATDIGQKQQVHKVVQGVAHVGVVQQALEQHLQGVQPGGLTQPGLGLGSPGCMQLGK